MRYGIPAGYRPAVSKQATLRYALLFTDALAKELAVAFKAITVDVPEETDAMSGWQPAGTNRPVNFDTLHSAKTHRIVADPDCYLVQTAADYGLALGSSLLVRGTFLRRDGTISSAEASCAQMAQVEGAVNAVDALVWKDFIHERVQTAYNAINTAIAVMGKFKQHDPFSVPKVMTAEQLQKRFWSAAQKELISDACQKHGCLTIDTPFLLNKKLPDGLAVCSIDPLRHCQSFVYAPSFEAPLLLVEAGIRPSAESVKGKERILQSDRYGGRFVDLLLAQKLPATYYVKVHVTALLAYVLKKVHVAEVVSAVWSDDFVRHCSSIGLEIL